MDILDSQVYYGLKESIRKAVKNISEEKLAWHEMPIILVDFYQWEAIYFNDEYEAKDYVEKHHTSGFDEAPEGKDEELVLIKYCTQYHKDKWDTLYSNYKFYKEVNGEKLYREVTFVEFEPELVINVHI